MNIKNLLLSVLTCIKRVFFFQSSFYFLGKATLGTWCTSCYSRLILFEAMLVQSSEVTEFIRPGPCLRHIYLFPIVFHVSPSRGVASDSLSCWAVLHDLSQPHLVPPRTPRNLWPTLLMRWRYFTSACWNLGALIILERVICLQRNQLTKGRTHIVSEWGLCLQICFSSHFLFLHSIFSS